MAQGKAILYDSSKCSSCKGCQVACKTWNNLASPIEKNAQPWTGSYQCPPDLDTHTRLVITFDEKPREKYGVDWAFGRRSCMHCTNAACVMVCPSGCLFHDEETGMVSIDNEKCIGCQYCHSACPFDVPRHQGVSFMGTEAIINKCTGCIDRIKNGRSPACVSTCQSNALQFGEWSDMLAKAKERAEVLKAKGFDAAQVYGEEQMGGTHVIYVLKYPLEQYKLPENPQVSPLIGAMNWFKPILGVGSVALLGGLGISFLRGVGYKRDEMHYDELKHDIVDLDTGEVIRHIDKEAGER
ncbi:MAG: 4Fe-4S dicluster domain-containing protein [Eggerthellaceae bacterium]|nr:4Fe-4S dicluster domain-containing protein [Eggerthellaceae bacterium]